MMSGLPRSGKSTVAKALGYPIVEPDAIRQVIHGTPFKPEVEHIIWSQARLMVQCLFEAGHDDVILDATNGTPARRAEWFSKGWRLKMHVLKTDLMTCLLRAENAGQHYLIDVIKRMHSQWDTTGIESFSPEYYG